MLCEFNDPFDPVERDPRDPRLDPEDTDKELMERLQNSKNE
jgi:hypothetical protein